MVYGTSELPLTSTVIKLYQFLAFHMKKDFNLTFGPLESTYLAPIVTSLHDTESVAV